MDFKNARLLRMEFASSSASVSASPRHFPISTLAASDDESLSFKTSKTPTNPMKRADSEASK